MNDIQKERIFNKLVNFRELSQQWPDLILGGSLALMLQNQLPYRESSDIDLVGHRYNAWDNQTIIQQGSSIDDTECIMIQIGENKFDFFINPFVIYSTINLLDVKIKVQVPSQIVQAKLKYFAKYNMTKHRDDIIAYLDIAKNGYKELTIEESTKSETDDLPF